VVRRGISPNGEFDFQNQSLSPGRYDVSVANSQRAVVKIIEATGARVAGQSIEIADATTVRLTLTLSQGLGQVSGTVLRGRRPLPGAMVVLVPEHPENNLSLFRRDQSDSDGTFTLPSVLPGKYTVVAIEDGWELAWSETNIIDRYLTKGALVNVAANGKYDVETTAQ
jgi:hypothetical protein